MKNSIFFCWTEMMRLSLVLCFFVFCFTIESNADGDGDASLSSSLLSDDTEKLAMINIEKKGRKVSQLLKLLLTFNVPAPVSWTMGDDLLALSEEVGEQFKFSDEDIGHLKERMLRMEEDAMGPVADGFTRPPRELPDEMWDDYTMGSEVPVTHLYRDDSVAGFYESVSRDEIELLIRRSKNGKTGTNYPAVDRLMYEMKKKGQLASIEGKVVGIMGSAFPWYEAMCLAFGAKKVVTIEYNKLEYDHPHIETVTVKEYEEMRPKLQFDVALSISSFEHDGLGRYGDPLDAEGDLKAMEKMRTIVKPGGILILAIPVGADHIIWNLHRVYGRKRLPLMLNNWTVLHVAGLTKEMLDEPRRVYVDQPVFVLKNEVPDEDWKP